MHSTWSDGSQTLEDIIEAGISLGLPFLRRDRSLLRAEDRRRRLDGGAGGAAPGDRPAEPEVSRQVSAAQGDRSEHPRRRHRSTWSRTSCALLEIVVAAPHSVLRSPDDQTARMVNAVSTPGVHILGHPRGRMIGSRPGVSADWDRVFKAAAKSRRRDRDRRRPVAAGSGLRHRAARGRRRLPLRARQRRALDRRAAPTPTPRSPTRASPASPPIASSIAGRWSGCSSGRSNGRPEGRHYLATPHD